MHSIKGLLFFCFSLATAFAEGEPRDEKGRTPSEFAAEQQRYHALNAKRDARWTRALEARRQAVALGSAADECLAYHRVDRRCLVTVGEFNRRLAEDAHWVAGLGDSVLPAPRILDIRHQVLGSLLETRYADAVIDRRADAGTQADEAWRSHLAGMEAALGAERLRASFRKHADWFGPKREVQADFLGASDSSFLDSLLGCMLEPPRMDASDGKVPGGKGCGSGRPFQWGRLQSGDLSGELPQVAAKLRQGEVSGIMRGSFGWFAIAAAKVTEIPAKTYAEALPQLVYMVETGEAPPRIAASGKAPSAPRGPATAGSGPAGPEAAFVKTWLLPRAAGKRKDGSLPAWSDTISRTSLRLRISDLPDGVGCQALPLLLQHRQAILSTRFGTWYFRAEGNLPLARQGEASPCAPETGTPRPEPTPLSQSAEYLASKEKDFKQDFLESQPRVAGSQEPGVDTSSLRARWIAENVAFANAVLERL